MMKGNIIITVVLMLFFQVENVDAVEKVLYGEDNRTDVCNSVSSQHESWARSTAAMIPTSSLFEIDKYTYGVPQVTLADHNICSYVRFADQVKLAKCSGFLVAPDLLVTAGHCVNSTINCKYNSWVFDFKIEGEGIPLRTVNKENVYRCKKIVAWKYEEETRLDFSVIKLDRPVRNREPLKIRKYGRIELGEPLVVTGHPEGLPLKIASNGFVRHSDHDNFFIANLDTFKGNSGSPVINGRSGLVEGILVRGDRDYIRDEENNCKVLRTCSMDGCAGEDITRITSIHKLRYL